MNGPIAQIVALTCYGNALLWGHDSPTFSPTNSTCTFCDSITFVEINKPWIGKPKEKAVALTPDAWFKYLKARGATGIRLRRNQENDPEIPDRMSSAFVGGGGTWALEVLFPNGRSEYWIARWEVWNQKAPDRKIWRVTYGRVSEARTGTMTTPDLPAVSKNLEDSLKAVRSFSTKHKLDSFTKMFDDALDTLESEGKRHHGYHRDLGPASFLDERAEMLLDACQRAWVFGGMGSWNDMGFDGDDGKEYERISEVLFQSVNAAIEAAATLSYDRAK